MTNGNDCRSCETLNGVVCEVKSCTYHVNQQNCCAEAIEVGPVSAKCCSDTVCATYKKNSNMQSK